MLLKLLFLRKISKATLFLEEKKIDKKNNFFKQANVTKWLQEKTKYM
jgi:hypothetical protein